MSARANKGIKLSRVNRIRGIPMYILTILKSSVFCIFAFAIVLGIYQSVNIGSFSGFLEGVSAGILWAFVLVPILIILDISTKVKCFIKFKTVDLRVNQERRFRIEDDYLQIFDTLCNILQGFHKVKIKKKDIKNGIIEAVTGRSWRSFGEKIDAKLFKGSNSKVTVTFSSKPRISLTMIDYSKNFENAALFLEGVKQRFNENVVLL
jgi:hypothetical protein